jgi:hypothetical protein
MTELSPGVFRLLLSLLVVGTAGFLLVADLVKLARLPSARRDPLLGDKRFGYVIGIVIGVIGFVGTARFNGLL